MSEFDKNTLRKDSCIRPIGNKLFIFIETLSELGMLSS
jgi:hypothetical protein